MEPSTSLVSHASLWRAGASPADVTLEREPATGGALWVELGCGAEQTQHCFELLAPHCPGLEAGMLENLLTPDEEPEGISYANGSVRLASAFRAGAIRPRRHHRRGTAQGIGILVFEPLELLASEHWLITCSHPSRIFHGAEVIEEGKPLDLCDLQTPLAKTWAQRANGSAGDLGVAVMYELALSYRHTARELRAWLEDWELSLYVKDDLDNADELPELWSLMAVLRDWLNPLNPPGVRKDIERAWLPATDHEAVIAVDERIDKTLADIAALAETLRQSFGLLHLEQAEAQRQQSEKMQHRIEIAAAVFLVPTLIVGFYGANTWVPGQGRHWGFWVMVGCLIILSAVALVVVTASQRRNLRVAKQTREDRKLVRTELLGGTRQL